MAFAKLTSTQEELKRSEDLTRRLIERFNALESQLKLFEAKFNDQQYSLHHLLINDDGEKVNALEMEVGTLQERAEELEDRMKTVEMILKDDAKKEDSLEKSFQLGQGPLNQMRKIEQKESKFLSKYLPISWRNEICSEIRPGVWTKEWKIKGFKRFLKRAEEEAYEIWSNPFLLGAKGYKVKLGVGISDSYLNIYLVIMKSENDVILQWPFCHHVSYKVIDQKRNPSECRHKIASNYLMSSSFTNDRVKSFGRPELEENRPWANQIPLSCLSERCYLLYDAVIINVEVSSRQ